MPLHLRAGVFLWIMITPTIIGIMTAPHVKMRMSVASDASFGFQGQNSIPGYSFSHYGYWDNYISQGGTTSLQKCADKCDAFAGCIAFVRVTSSGNCYVFTELGQQKQTQHAVSYTRDVCHNVEGWTSSGGATCTSYETHNLCTAVGGYGPGWKSAWGTFANYQRDGQDALTACCACGGGVQAGNINIRFGATSHYESTSVSSGHSMRMRPELIKSKTCSATMCKVCDSRTACWHGGAHTVGLTDYDGLLLLDVNAGSPSTRYVAEVWARCGSSGGTWKADIFTLTNGELSIFMNGQLVRTVTEADVQAGLSNHFALGQYLTVNLDITGDSRIETSFLPTNAGMASSVMMGISAYDLQPIVDDCMSVKNCLEVFGDSSDASFKIRNGNQVQLDCLNENVNGMSAAVQAKCTEWKACMTADQKHTLQGYLRAAGNAALIEEAAVGSTRRKIRSDGCMDPAVDDPESWECDCVQAMINYCVGVHEANEACFKHIWCNHNLVCNEWKTRNNCPNLLMLEENVTLKNKKASSLAVTQMKQRTSVELTATAKATVVDTFDGALQGKCG